MTTCVSRYQTMMVTTGAIRRAKLQSNHHYQQTNTRLFQAGCPSCRPTNSVRALKGVNRWLRKSKIYCVIIVTPHSVIEFLSFGHTVCYQAVDTEVYQADREVLMHLSSGRVGALAADVRCLPQVLWLYPFVRNGLGMMWAAFCVRS